MIEPDGLKELIEEAEEIPRGIISIGKAVELLMEADLEVRKNIDRSDICPYCGADAEDTETPLSRDGEPYVSKPHLNVFYEDRKAKIPFVVPMQRNRATGFPVFSVGMNDLITAVARVILGGDYERPSSLAIGAGKKSEQETRGVIRQLKESDVLAHLLKEE